MPILSIIIVSYNTRDLTFACVSFLLAQYEKEVADGKVEIIVVDNGSSDETVKDLSKLKLSGRSTKKIKLILNTANLGFAKGSNIGASRAAGKYLLFLNSDTKIIDTGFLKMVNFLEENKNIAILGCRFENIDRSVQKSAGAFYNSFNIIFVLLGLEGLLYRFSPAKIEKVDWVSGACMMIRSSIFKMLNGFDEDFFMYVEDMDICFRAKLKGFHTYFYPDAFIIHREHASSNRSYAVSEIYKGILLFYKKHRSALSFAYLKMLLRIKAIVLVVFGRLTNNSYLTKTYAKAFSYCR